MQQFYTYNGHPLLAFKMLFVVGDSNSVYTSEALSVAFMDNKSMCRVGWTTEDVLRAVRRHKKILADASACFVFVGLNDRLTGEMIADNILQIIALLRASAPHGIPIIVAPPFCVAEATPVSLCADRKFAAKRVVEMLAVQSGVYLVAPHVRADMTVPAELQTVKRGSRNVDPLHLLPDAYEEIARAVEMLLVPRRSPSPRRSRKSRAPRMSPSPRRSRARRSK